MGFTIPNRSDAFDYRQAQTDRWDWEIVVAGCAKTGVVSGCNVSAQGTPDMTLAVAAGEIQYLGTSATVTGGNVTITAADVVLPRFDLVVVSSAGVKSVVAGTPSATPVFPTVPGSSVVLAAVFVPPLDTAIAGNQIVDKRVGILLAGAGGGSGDVATDVIFDAKGDLPVGTGPNAAARLAVGANDTVLTAASGQTTGTIWQSIGTASIANDAVTYQKIQNVTDSRLLGRSAGSAGDVQEITVGSGLALASGSLTVGVGTIFQTFTPEEAQTLATAQPDFVKTNGTNFPVTGMAFGSAATESAYFKTDALAYASGNLLCRIYWYAATATAGDVKWEVAIACITPDVDTQNVETKAFATTQSVVDTHQGTTGKRLHIAAVTISNLDAIAADDIVWIRLSRLGADAADTMTGDAIMVTMRLAYTG